MTDKEKIIAEIERLTEVTGYALSEYENGRRSAMYDIRKQLIEYINSLPAEQQSEELEEEIKRKYKSNNALMMPIEDFRKIIIHFTDWQKQRTINKACEWLNKNVVEYHPRKGELRPIVNINSFREAMEKEDEQ